jgi:hypothetical protein
MIKHNDYLYVQDFPLVKLIHYFIWQFSNYITFDDSTNT